MVIEANRPTQNVDAEKLFVFISSRSLDFSIMIKFIFWENNLPIIKDAVIVNRLFMITLNHIRQSEVPEVFST